MGGDVPVARDHAPRRRAADRAWLLAAGVILTGGLWIAFARVGLTQLLHAAGMPAALASDASEFLPVLAAATLILLVEVRARDAAAAAFSALRDSEQRFREMLASVDLLAVALDRDGRVTFANAALLELLGVAADRVLGEPWTRFHSQPMVPNARPGRQHGVLVTQTGERRTVAWSSVTLLNMSGTDAGSAAIGEDVTTRQRLEVERARLAAAVEHAAESIIVTDPAGAILYVNPAFERVSGYRRDEVLGSNPRVLKSGAHSAAVYRAMWHQLAAGQPWSGEVVNRRKDGSLYREELTISPVRDDAGEIVAHVSVQRDVTRERAIEAGLERATQERSHIAAALGRLHAAELPEQTAAAICAEVVTLPDVEFATIIAFTGPRLAVPLAVEAPPDSPLQVGRPLPPDRSGHLFARASEGPWADHLRARDEDELTERRIAEAGSIAVSYAPLWHGSELLGVLAIGSGASSSAAQPARLLPAALEFAAISAALLAPSLHGRRHEADLRSEIRRIIADGAFAPVFQPVFDLSSRAIVGWEALTRFANGVRPDQQFAEAHAVGLGLDLEEACLDAAISASALLPGSGWVSLNVSPPLITERNHIRRLLERSTRATVLEVTEHAAVLDYAEIRSALDSFGAGVRLAVDDAGAGYASLYHVVELDPDFVKLDRSLVADVDRDQARQALVAGMCHFARTSGCELIAEGVERVAERDVLGSLEVPFAQGYLLGRPAPATTWARPRSPTPLAARRAGTDRPEERYRTQPSRDASTQVRS